MNPLLQRRDDLLATLALFPDAHARLDHLMDEARALPPLPEADRTDDRLVPGCLARLWFVPSFDGTRCHFACQSDALIVQAIAGLLCTFYSDATPSDILAVDAAFLREAGITQHLSSNRRDALTRLAATIRAFAASCADKAPPHGM